MLRQRKVLILLVVVIVGVAGAAYFMNRKDTPKPAVAPDKPVTTQAELNALQKEREAEIKDPVTNNQEAEKVQQEVQKQAENPPALQND